MSDPNWSCWPFMASIWRLVTKSQSMSFAMTRTIARCDCGVIERRLASHPRKNRSRRPFCWTRIGGKEVRICRSSSVFTVCVASPMHSVDCDRSCGKTDTGTAAVSYDDEQSIAESARQLSAITDELFAGEDRNRPKIALVGHSMGGLVAREWTENKELKSDRISTLITIASPHGGSNWATMPPLLDLVWKGDFDKTDFVDVVLHQPSAAGLRDLIPGSKQLRTMASRPRRVDVKYTTIVGTGSPVSDSQTEKLSEILRSIDGRSRVFRLIRPRVQPLVDGLDELVRGKGDGVVRADHATNRRGRRCRDVRSIAWRVDSVRHGAANRCGKRF